jgi:hypothetical protein
VQQTRTGFALPRWALPCRPLLLLVVVRPSELEVWLTGSRIHLKIIYFIFFYTQNRTLYTFSMTKQSITLGISELSLSVNNIVGTSDFLSTCGFHRLHEIEDRATDHAMILTDGSVILRLVQIEQSRVHPFDANHNVGLNYLSIRVSSLEELQSLYKKVCLVRGTTPDFAPTELKGTKSVSALVHDPSGIPIHLSYCPTADESKVQIVE